MKIFYSASIITVLFFSYQACNNTPATPPKTQPANFTSFVKNFDTLPLPLVISFPGFLKSAIFIDHSLKPVESHYLKELMHMKELPPWPIFYYGQLPMMDSTYYLITYYEDKLKHNPSLWWTLNKFDYWGNEISRTNISYCMKDEDTVRERFCKVIENYQCFLVESQGRWDSVKHIITDTVLNTRTLNLTYDADR
jgi:hypothetical protein